MTYNINRYSKKHSLEVKKKTLEEIKGKKITE